MSATADRTGQITGGKIQIEGLLIPATYQYDKYGHCRQVRDTLSVVKDSSGTLALFDNLPLEKESGLFCLPVYVPIHTDAYRSRSKGLLL
jgi:hypothetical protein